MFDLCVASGSNNKIMCLIVWINSCFKTNEVVVSGEMGWGGGGGKSGGSNSGDQRRRKKSGRMVGKGGGI